MIFGILRQKAIFLCRLLLCRIIGKAFINSKRYLVSRFLVYNQVGIVQTIQDNNIDVDFHNEATHYNLFFNNPGNISNIIIYLANFRD